MTPDGARVPLLVLAMALLPSGVVAQTTAAGPAEWRYTEGAPGGGRYSPLAEIHRVGVIESAANPAGHARLCQDAQFCIRLRTGDLAGNKGVKIFGVNDLVVDADLQVVDGASELRTSRGGAGETNPGGGAVVGAEPVGLASMFESPATALYEPLMVVPEDVDTQVHRDEQGEVVGDIVVPSEAIFYDSMTNTWKTVGDNSRAMSKATYSFRLSGVTTRSPHSSSAPSIASGH